MYKHQLKFNRTNTIYEIDEPFGFDKAMFKVEKKRHSRNVIKADFDDVELHRTLNHQFDLVASELQLFGWQCDIDYILLIDNIEFKIGQIDGLASHIFKDFVKIKIIQDSLVSFVGKNENIEIDAFSNKSLKGQTITPCQTHKIWFKPKPINQKSEWGEKVLGSTVNFFGIRVMPIVNSLISFGVETSYSPFNFQPTVILGSLNESNHANRLLTAKNTLENVSINIKNLNIIGLQGSFFFLNIVRYFYNSDTNTINVVESIPLIPNLSAYENPTDININQTFNFPSISAGESIYINLNITNVFSWESYSCEGVEITGTSIAIGSVVKGIRLRDFIKHKIESVGGVYNDTVFNTPLYENNFVMNGRMIGGLDDLPFHATFKNSLETFCDEAFADFEIIDDDINIKPVKDFYLNSESESLDIATEHLYSLKPNSDLSLNTIEIGFKKSSADRTGNNRNTTDAVHTNMQLRYDTERADAIKKIEFDHIRCDFLLEEQRRKANVVEEKTTALENDENLFAVDCVPMTPNFTNTFTRFLRGQVEVPSQIMTILSDGTFKWTNLGMVVGQTIQEGGTSLQITQITDFQLKALRLNNPFAQTSTFEFNATITYVIQGVPYLKRTNEGFSVINGIENPQTYGNLNFSLKRIFNRHLDWWLNAGQFLVGKNIDVKKIAINDKLETRLTSESVLTIDKAPTIIADGGFLSGFVLNCKVFSDFETALNIVNNRNKFISVEVKNSVVLSGWLKDFQYNWRSNELFLDLELTKESLYLGFPYIFNLEF
jgi:hypothetical protein